jgi:hypothetical protein
MWLPGGQPKHSKAVNFNPPKEPDSGSVAKNVATANDLSFDNVANNVGTSFQVAGSPFLF